MTQNKKRRNRKGFTLIELIVVIAILAILAAIAIPAFSRQLENAKVRTNEANVKVLVSAAQVALASNGAADPAVTWNVSSTGAVTSTATGVWAPNQYIAEGPSDPWNGTGTYRVVITGNQVSVTDAKNITTNYGVS